MRNRTDKPTTITDDGETPVASSGNNATTTSGPILPIADDDSDESYDSDATREYFTREKLYALSSCSAVEGTHNGISAPDGTHENEYIMPDVGENADKKESVLELGITGDLRKLVDYNWENKGPPSPSEVYVVRYMTTDTSEVVVEREMNVLTLEEARANLPQVTKAIFDELVRWIECDSWARLPKWKANNVLDSRWVLKWKMINDIRAVKARLTARGYKEAQAYDVNTYAGTASRWGQRLVNMICAQKKWTLFSADISQAFLRGLTFEEIKELDGEIKREVQTTLPPGSIPVLRRIKGYEDFDPHTLKCWGYFEEASD